MAFDPEKVERHYGYVEWEELEDEWHVRATDYDQLLALYRKLDAAFEDSIEARSKGL